MKIISIIIKKIWIIIFILMLILASLFFSLKYGFSVNSIQNKYLKIDNLHIKLDKKFIIKANILELNLNNFTKKQENSQNQIQKNTKTSLKFLNYLPKIKKYFKEININQLKIANHDLSINFKEQNFFLKYDKTDINASFFEHEKGLMVKFSQIKNDDFNISINGDLIVDINENNFNFNSKFKLYQTSGNLKFYTKDNFLYYNLNTKETKSIKEIIQKLENFKILKQEVGAWIYKKIKAKTYEIKYIKGKINLKNYNYYPTKIKAKAYAKDILVHFHKDIKPANIDNIILTLDNNILSFKLNKAFFENKSLKNSFVKIFNVLTTKSYIQINLKTKALLDEKINEILRAFGINLPLIQTKGEVDSLIDLNINFKDYFTKVKGEFDIKNANFLISKVPFFSKSGKILLNRTNVDFINTNLSYKDIFSLNINGNLNTNSLLLKSNSTINSINLQSKQNTFLNIKDLNTTINASFKKDDFSIFLPQFNFSLQERKKDFLIKSSLKDISQYSKILKNYQILNGNIEIYTKNFDNFDIILHTKNIKTPLYKNNEIYKLNDISIKIDENKTYIKNLNSDELKLEIDENLYYIFSKNLDIMIDEKTNKNNQSKKTKTDDKIILNMQNLKILLKDLNKSLSFDKANIINHDSYYSLDANNKKGKINLSLSKDNLYVNAKNFDSKFINEFAKKDIFNGGSFNFSLSGLNEKQFLANFNFSNTIIKDYSYYQNLLSFINSIPQLVVFKSSNFNEEGFVVNKGEIIFSFKDNNIMIHQINLQGNDAILIGDGKINLKTKEIDINLSLITLQNVSNVIEKLPIINYILLGESKKIAISLKLSGTLNNPKFETKILKDSIFAPLNLLKRTIQAPFKLFD